MNPRLRLSLLALPLVFAAGPALADDAPPVDLAAVLTVDVAGASGDGAADGRVRALTNLDLTADADLERLVGWQGAHAFVYVLDNRGGRPNDALASLEGVDNIEVGSASTRLFEAWVEQGLGRGVTLKAGLVDLNSEFYATDSAGLLIGPPFGIGSEMAATGAAGPSIFPSSALAARLNLPFSNERGYLRVGVFNARAQTFGDPGGVDLSFSDGVLLVGEGGYAFGPLKLSAGAWGYTRSGTPGGPRAHGAYGMAELAATQGLTLFARGGMSDGKADVFSGAFNTGLRLAPALSVRPDSEFSVGFHQSWTADRWRADNPGTARIERGVEVTYADRINRRLSIQPNLQWLRSASTARSAVLGTLRLTLSI